MTGRSRKYYQNIRVPQRLPSLQCSPWVTLRANSALAQTFLRYAPKATKLLQRSEVP
jgi:hypothetical protein